MEKFIIVITPFSDQFNEMRLNPDVTTYKENFTSNLTMVKESHKMKNELVFKIIPFESDDLHYHVILFHELTIHSQYHLI
jgi:hypothetical protein